VGGIRGNHSLEKRRTSIRHPFSEKRGGGKDLSPFILRGSRNAFISAERMGRIVSSMHRRKKKGEENIHSTSQIPRGGEKGNERTSNPERGGGTAPPSASTRTVGGGGKEKKASSLFARGKARMLVGQLLKREGKEEGRKIEISLLGGGKDPHHVFPFHGGKKRKDAQDRSSLRGEKTRRRGKKPRPTLRGRKEGENHLFIWAGGEGGSNIGV